MKVILRTIGKGILWAIRLWLLASVLALVISPSWFTYQYIGWRWAAVVAVATIGVVWFIARFGPWLIGRWLARAIVKGITEQTDALIEEINSGVWDVSKRESVATHAVAEGIELS